jgi:S-adenosylmethionine hydrolase
MAAFITLTTDFGLADPYVASMKGSIYSLNPNATIIDVTHGVAPQAIEQAVFVLQYALPYLPQQSTHVLVVDPGVGTERRPLALVTPAATFIAPDNGLLSVALPDDVRASATAGPALVDLPSGFSAYELTNPAFHRHPVSVTFHGRDIFTPVAAHLSLGVQPQDLGPAASQVHALPPFRATVNEDESISGRVLHVDRYGNLITDIRRDQLAADPVTINVSGRTIAGISRTYAQAPSLAAVVASTGFLAIVVPNGSAARELGAGIGEQVRVRPA